MFPALRGIRVQDPEEDVMTYLNRCRKELLKTNPKALSLEPAEVFKGLKSLGLKPKDFVHNK